MEWLSVILMTKKKEFKEAWKFSIRTHAFFSITLYVTWYMVHTASLMNKSQTCSHPQTLCSSLFEFIQFYKDLENCNVDVQELDTVDIAVAIIRKG